MAKLSDDQRLLLTFLPDDGSAIGGHSLFAELQDAGWTTKEVERVMGELRDLGEILVGRGGGGGSIRHVRNDRRALLDALDEFEAEGKPATRPALQDHFDWRPDYLEQILDDLLEKEKIVIGPGRGGVITRAVADEDDSVEPPESTPAPISPDADERTLLDLIPETGTIGNTRLRKNLANHAGWSDERYWETRKRLRQQGRIDVGRGRGGSVRRVSLDAAVSTLDPVQPPIPPAPNDTEDDSAALAQVPESGESIDLNTLQQRLGWNNTRFYQALERLEISQRLHWNRTRVMRLIPGTPDAGTPQHAERPQPNTPPPNPHTELYSFFCDRFESRTLEIFLTYSLHAPSVVQSIAWNQDLRTIAHHVLNTLVKQNYIDHQFFELLRAFLPRLHPQIDALAKLWPASH